MAEPDDLLGKADALMARHRPQLPPEPYPEIPVLDEVVELPEEEELPVLTEYVVPAPFDEEQARALAEGMRASLLAELQPEVDALIEERLKQALGGLIERMTEELCEDLQLAARQVLRDAIANAIEQEIERRKAAG